MGRYALRTDQPDLKADIVESHEKRYPTRSSLSAGGHFVERGLRRDQRGAFPRPSFRGSPETSIIDPLDGYRRLASNQDSRLGWRILLHTDPLSEGVKRCAEAIERGEELSTILPAEYRTRHREIANIVGQILDGHELSDEDAGVLLETTGVSAEEAAARLGRDLEEKEEAPEEEGDPDPTSPSIVCTSLLGAKGLSAGHVFVVGFIDGAFPADPNEITDDEICKLIVALSRTRKACHLVSCGRFAADWTRPSRLGESSGMSNSSIER